MIEEAREEEILEKTPCKKVLELFQEVLRSGNISKEETWQAVVLISKGGGDLRIIGFVKILLNKISIIMENQLVKEYINMM